MTKIEYTDIIYLLGITCHFKMSEKMKKIIE
jgi:hypothetical protein